MTARPSQILTAFVAVCLAVATTLPDARAAEPNSAPPLAPVPTDVRDITVVTTNPDLLPAGRRDQGQFAPQMLSGDSYTVEDGSMVYTEGEGEYATAFDYNPDEASVRISDLPAEQQGAYVPGLKPSKLLCPHCRFCEHGLPYHECPECDPTRKDIRKYTRKHGLRLPPDYGWAPPARAPIERVGIDYYRAFPGCWTGQQAYAGPAIVRPQVYWPTDTTQMGYTYQQTPMWICYPGMVPPVPAPSQWHLPLCQNCGPNVACPHCRQRGHGAAHHHEAAPGQEWIPEESVPQEQLVPQDPVPDTVLPAVPAQAAQLPIGPELQPSATSPSLAPVPF